MRRCDYCARLFVNGSRLNGKDDRIRTIYPHNTHNTATVWFYRAVPLAVQTTDHARNFKMIMVRDGGRRVMPVLSRINSIFALTNQSYTLVKNRRFWSLFTAGDDMTVPTKLWPGQFLFKANRDRWGQTIIDSSPSKVSIASVLTRFTKHYPHTFEPDHRYRFNTDYLPRAEQKELDQLLLDANTPEIYDDGSFQPPDDENDDYPGDANLP